MDFLIGEDHGTGGGHSVVDVEASFAGADRIVDLVHVGLFGLQSRPLNGHSAGGVDGYAAESSGFGRNVEAHRTVDRVVISEVGIAHVKQALADGHFFVAGLQHDKVLRHFSGAGFGG